MITNTQKRNEIQKAKIDDQVAPVLKLMAAKKCSAIEVVDRGTVVGLFLPTREILSQIENGTLDADTTFYQLKKYIN